MMRDSKRKNSSKAVSKCVQTENIKVSPTKVGEAAAAAPVAPAAGGGGGSGRTGWIGCWYYTRNTTNK